VAGLGLGALRGLGGGPLSAGRWVGGLFLAA